MSIDNQGTWVESGGALVLVAPSADYLSSKAPKRLSGFRALRAEQIRAEALRRLQLVSAAIESADDVRMLALLWPVLNAPGTNATLAKLRDIYLYAKTKTAAIAAADLATVQAYDPAADAGWPV